MGTVIEGQAVTYRGHRQRYLTLRAACRSLAWAAVRARFAKWGDEMIDSDADQIYRVVNFMAKVYETDFKRRSALEQVSK